MLTRSNLPAALPRVRVWSRAEPQRGSFPSLEKLAPFGTLREAAERAEGRALQAELGPACCPLPLACLCRLLMLLSVPAFAAALSTNHLSLFNLTTSHEEGTFPLTLELRKQA